MKKIKKWNWTIAVVTFSICVFGSLINPNYESTMDSFYAGLIIGIPFSLFSAWFFK